MTCECNPKCDDCDCREKIDISTPHFETEDERECQLAEEYQVGIDPNSYTKSREQLIHDPGELAFVNFIKNRRGFSEVIDDEFHTEYLPTTDQLNDSRVCVEEVTIKPESGHHTIRDYTSTETAFAFSEPDESTKKQPNDTIDGYLARPHHPVANDYEKIANRRFTDYLKDEFTVFSVSDYFSTIVHYNDTRYNIQPTKESIYTLKDELKWIDRLLATGDEFSLILYTRLTFDELKTKRSKIIRKIDELESQLNDLFYDKHDYSALLSEGQFAETADAFASVFGDISGGFSSENTHTHKLMFAVRYAEGMSIGVVADKTGHKHFTKVDFVSPFDTYDEIVAFRRLFNDYKRFIDNQTKETK